MTIKDFRRISMTDLHNIEFLQIDYVDTINCVLSELNSFKYIEALELGIKKRGEIPHRPFFSKFDIFPIIFYDFN